MEGRVWAMLGAFMFIVCFAAVVSYYFEIDSRRKDWASAQAEVKAVTQALINMESQAENARKSFEEAEAETSGVQKLIASKGELKTAVEALQKKRKAAVEAYKQSVQDIRNAAVGTSWPEFSQGTRTLRGVKIRSITDTEVTFSHDEGVAKLNKDTLPEAARDRFRIELFPMLPEPPAKDASEGLATLTTPEGAPMPAPAGAAPQIPADATAQAKLQIEIDAHEQRISTLNTHRQEWLRRARTFRSQASDATFNGRPSYSFNQQALQAEQNADLTSAQIEKIRKEITGLRKRQLEPTTATAQ
jgi:hypothetical protein